MIFRRLPARGPNPVLWGVSLGLVISGAILLLDYFLK